MNILISCVKTVFLLVAWFFWAVLGTIYWLGLVARALAVFSFSFLYAMFTGQGVPTVQNSLEELTELWFDGFRSAYESLFGNPSIQRIEVRNGRLALEILWGLIYWLASFAFALALSGKFLPTIEHYGNDIGTFFAGAIVAFAKIIHQSDNFVMAVVATVIIFLIFLIFVGGVFFGVYINGKSSEGQSNQTRVTSALQTPLPTSESRSRLEPHQRGPGANAQLPVNLDPPSRSTPAAPNPPRPDTNVIQTGIRRPNPKENT